MATEAPGERIQGSPRLAPLVRSYRQLGGALVFSGVVSAVAVKAAFTPSAVDIAVSLVSGAPAWVISRRRVTRQLRHADLRPAARTEPVAATMRRFLIRVGWLTLFLATALLVVPLALGASHDFVGNTAGFGAGFLLSNGYACLLLSLSASAWEQKHDRLILTEVRPHWSINPITIHVVSTADDAAAVRNGPDRVSS